MNKKMSVDKKIRKRAPNLDDHAIERIVCIIDEWGGDKLTWNILLDEIARHLRSRYVRQTLDRYSRISDAYKAKRKKIAERGKKNDKSKFTPDQERIARLEVEVERLKRENNNLLEQFNRWVYNGHRKQMDDRMREAMNKPLPKIHRAPSS